MTERELFIKAALESGQTLKETGHQLGICQERVRQIAVRAGIEARALPRLSHDEKVEAMRLYRRGMPMRHINKAIGRGGVQYFLKISGLHQSAGSLPGRPWTKRDAERLPTLLATNSFSQAAAKLKRSIGSVLGKAHRLGLCEKDG